MLIYIQIHVLVIGHHDQHIYLCLLVLTQTTYIDATIVLNIEMTSQRTKDSDDDD